ncbi:MAG: potassium transporter TrkG [Candidatus Micrarchaeota archaeon]
MFEFGKKLAAVLFFASLPLFIPLAYSVAAGDGAWPPILLTIVLLALPAVPQLTLGIIENILGIVRKAINPETPFNYARIIGTERIQKEVEVLTLGEILAITSLAWLIVPAVTTIPYIYFGVPPLDAFFESMSGWTSTGLSALTTVSAVPQSLLLFRSVTQWVGGIGIMILVLSTTRGREAVSFLKAEGRNETQLGIASTVRATFGVYLALTLVFIALASAAGFGLFEAVNLTFSGISNGGFFPFDSHPMSDMQKLVLAGMMFAGATSVLFFRNVWRGQVEKAVTDEEFLAFAGVTALAVLLISFGGGGGGLNAVLNAVAAITGGGFSLGDIPSLGAFGMYVLIILMLLGGMTGSTTGAIKFWRILVIFKALARQVREGFMPPGAVQVVKINNLPINERMIVESAIFVFAYILIFLAASGAFMAASYGTEDSLFLVATALGNVGLSTVSIPAVGAAGKVLLIFLMYIGRIEIFPSLALAALITRR